MRLKVVTLIDSSHIGFLVDQVRQGNERAFEQLHHMFQGAVYKLARYKVGEAHAEDVVQETFFRAHRYLHTLRSDIQFGPWLLRIARNVAHDYVRRVGQLRAAESEDIDVLAHVLFTNDSDVTEYQLDLDRILQTIPSLYLSFLQLHYLQGLTVPEISLATGLPVSTVKWRIHRGIHLCRLAVRDREDAKFGPRGD
jgi:RNA polymerase sigma-70 factor (ECF subfamily)